MKRPRLRGYVEPEPEAEAEPEPQAQLSNNPPAEPTARVSGINPVFPVFGVPTTVSVRNNFQAAKDEIEELQAGKLDLAGGTMAGNIQFAPTQRLDGGTFGPPPFARR